MFGITWRAPDLATELSALGRTLIVAPLNSYRPERHYMRGPGPKWQAKHGRGLVDPVVAVPKSARRLMQDAAAKAESWSGRSSRGAFA